MSHAPHFRTQVLAARERLTAGREKLRARHAQGTPGVQVSRGIAVLFDSVVLDVYAGARDSLDIPAAVFDESIALVAHGGFGRGDMAPYSDVDLMILHAPGAKQFVPKLAERLVRDLFDVGIVLGQSVRTIAQACQLAREDPVIATSLIESRLLTGSEPLFDDFRAAFAKKLQRRPGTAIAAFEKARTAERVQYRETVFLLEPNLKRSPGGLRDLQLLRWVGFAAYGAASPDDLRLRQALSTADHAALREALEFLLRLRNDMHFHAGKAYDVLDRAEQLRLAETLGFQGDAGLLPVEQFMREYFQRTRAVWDVTSRFVATAQGTHPLKRLARPLVSHRFERDFIIEPTQVSLNARGAARVAEGDLGQILRLVEVAGLFNKSLSHQAREAIRAAAPNLTDSISSEAAASFVSLLGQPARLPELLHNLHDMGLLERVIPQMRHARGLLQFNAYHKYTVDEHSLRAVEEATNFIDDPGPVGSAYRYLKRKWLLHLALLIHDLGKGYAVDHSDVGLTIATDTARRLRLSDDDAETLKFLVHKHLMMSHLAFRRDTSDPQLIVRFAVDVGSPEVLQMLFVLTAADTAAVGPGTLNAWKVEVLAELFHRTMHQLGAETHDLDIEASLAARRLDVLARLKGDTAWFERQLVALPASYLRATASEQIAADLLRLRQLGPRDATAQGRYLPETGAVEYQVATYEDVSPGIFHKLTGALTGQGLQILTAEIVTLADGLVYDRFCVRDPDFAGAPPEERLSAVQDALLRSLLSPDGAGPVARRLWQPAHEQRQASLSSLPTQVRIDNSTSDACTIIELFTADRMGLLYTVTRTLFELGLSVSVAKIGTYLDQVVDVFYVADQQGRKVLDEDRLHHIRDRLLEQIASLN